MISIVVPVYNSSKIIGELIGRLNDWQQEISFRFRVIFIDDASVDQSHLIIEQT